MTIKEVARLAGVSPAAVSRYFNGGSLGRDKQIRIRKVVEKTGFHPNPLAKSMRTGRSSQIGVIVPKIRSDSVTRILQGISDVIREENYIMILGDTEHDEMQEVRLIRAMQDNCVDGIILMGRTMTEGLRTVLAECSVPVVVTGQRFDGAACVYHDDFHAMEELTEGVVRGKGTERKHPAYIGVLEEDEQAGHARREGVESALRKEGFSMENVPELIADFTTEDGMRAARQLLSEHPETDAVICASDFAAFGVMSAIRESGRKIPEDIAVAGCGDIWASLHTAPPLTSVRFFYEECGKKAAMMLMDQIRGSGANEGKRDGEEAEEPQQIMLGYDISWRKSH